MPFRRPLLTSMVSQTPIAFLHPQNTRPYNIPAVLIPGDGVLESTTVGGTITFFNIYQNVLVARILLSWFPGLQGNPIVRPLITVSDPYLNLFRSVVPPIFGLDLSPVLALLLLQAFSSATAALGCERAENVHQGTADKSTSILTSRRPRRNSLRTY